MTVLGLRGNVWYTRLEYYLILFWVAMVDTLELAKVMEDEAEDTGWWLSTEELMV